MSEHTKGTATKGPWFVNGPWHIQAPTDPKLNLPVIVAQVVKGNAVDLAQQEANAELIVLAVNAHAELVEALKAVIRRGCSCSSNIDPDWHAPDSVLSPGCPIPIVKAALRKAGAL